MRADEAAIAGEFELIARFFTRTPRAPGFVRRGVGDDCAVLDVAGRTLALTTDMLLAERHFRATDDPASIGHKALAVNLSDLAAAGAAPRCFLLALALPQADPSWLRSFANGLFALADEFACELVGGDTTRVPAVAEHDGPLTICITAIGEVAGGRAHSRAGARDDDDLWVSGELGDAALALAHAAGAARLDETDAAAARVRLQRPQPRVALGLGLCAVATACIDVSDGLLGDLGHLLEQSGVGAELWWPALPLSSALSRQDEPIRQRCALAGGDDYELLFTAPPARRTQVEAAAVRAAVRVTRIGRMAGQGLRVLDANGQRLDVTALHSYDHFAP
jgi:thiamine-monophosphate kinase